MNWGNFMIVWEEFMDLLDRVFQWLQYVFGAIDTWPPEEYPDINEQK